MSIQICDMFEDDACNMQRTRGEVEGERIISRLTRYDGG